MTYSQILQIEDSDIGRIHMYHEGLFLRAYQQSAFLLHTTVYPFKVSRRFIKAVNETVYSVGFCCGRCGVRNEAGIGGVSRAADDSQAA